MLQNRVELLHGPTPCYPLSNLSESLGEDIWIKRDDLTPFAGGGNKARKLEYWMWHAKEGGYQGVLTSGAVQSNFVRQCAAACRMFGLDFRAVAMHSPYPDESRKLKIASTSLQTGNAVLNSLLGVEVVVVPDGTWDDLANATQSEFRRWSNAGVRVLLIPPGGSAGIGALGFVRAAREVMEQGPLFDNIVVASGSGSTQTGLVYELKRANERTRVVGICTDNEPEMTHDFSSIAAELDELLMDKLRLAPSDFDLKVEYAGEGYQAPTQAAQSAQQVFARTEGIFLDPVYTAKAGAGLLSLVDRGELKGRTLFWHTGGFPALFTQPSQ